MLGKVMKYEMRATGRLLWPFFGLVLLLCTVLRVVTTIAPLIWEPIRAILNTLVGSLGIFALFGVVMLSFVYVVVRFYQSMVANEGILTFTLPTKPGTQLAGKFIVGSLFCTLSFVVSIIGALILIPGFFTLLKDGGIPINMGSSSMTIPFSSFPADIIASFIGFIVASIIVSVVSGLLMIYASLALAPIISKNRILGGVVVYFILSTIESFLALPAMLPFMLKVGFTNDQTDAYMASLVSSDMFASLRNVMGLMWYITFFSLGISLLVSVAHYFITWYMFTKKLNME